MKKLLVIGLVWPEPKGSAAGSRLLQLIGLFKSSGCHVTFASTSKKSPNRYDLSTLDVEEQVIALNDSSFDEFIKGIEPDIVLFDRFMSEEQFGWRVAEHCPKALRILDTEDFHGLRKAREEAVKQGTSTSMAHLQNDTTKREIASIYRCDLSLIISEAEMEILTQDFKIDSRLLHYVPFLLDFPRGEQKNYR